MNNRTEKRMVSTTEEEAKLKALKEAWDNQIHPLKDSLSIPARLI
jgi:hypothetical protein